MTPVFVVHNHRGSVLAHVNVGCRYISVELPISFIPGQPLTRESSAALITKEKSNGGRCKSSQSFHLKVTYVTSYYLKGQSKSRRQAAVWVLLRSDTLFLNEWMGHIYTLL